MRGNAAILKCTIPSFVADFVSVVEWIDEEGKIYKPSGDGDLGKNTEKTNSLDEMGTSFSTSKLLIFF